MSVIREEAFRLIDAMPEAVVIKLVEYMKNYDTEHKRDIFLEMLDTDILVKKTGLNVEEYMKEMRDDRI
ncbi:MAG: hypothetical protein J6M62_06080 [Selenomonadaceae bacterium]|nr:hypothetical protein [Selenomonadaceae bacterium]MBP3722665.1 hypothetical protein [Selenomonadaceae bacterium]